MPNFDNSNRISLWLNDKRQEATHPHLTGSGETSTEVWANAWFSKDLPIEDGRALHAIIKRHAQVSKKPFISVSLKPKQQRRSETASYAEPAAPEFDDDIPF